MDQATSSILSALPAPVKVFLLGLGVVSVTVILVVLVIRVAKGAPVNVPWLGEIGSSKQLDELRGAVEELNQDSKLKKNVLVTLRSRLESAKGLVEAGADVHAVQSWMRDLLVDAASVINRGHHDRHRAAMWVPESPRLLRMYAAVGFRADAVQHARLSNPGSKAAEAMLLRRTLIVDDIDAERGFEPKSRTSEPDYKSLLVVPVLLSRGRVAGVICIDAEAPAYFTADDAFFIECLATSAALLLSRFSDTHLAQCGILL